MRKFRKAVDFRVDIPFYPQRCGNPGHGSNVVLNCFKIAFNQRVT